MVATCNMPRAQKAKILKWWNSSAPSCNARKFPLKPVSENLLPLFLAKCVWYAGVRELFLLLISSFDSSAWNGSMNLKKYLG